MEKKRRGQKKVVAKNKKKFPKKYRLGILFIVLLLISMLVYKQWVVPTKEAKRPLSILLVGADSSEYRDEHYSGTKPTKTDALMVLTFNPDTYKFVISSIPRDTSVDYICPSITTEYQDQINELYFVGGESMDCLEATVSNFLNVPIDYYVKVNMDQLSNIIDAVGGVTIKAYAPDGSLSQVNVDGSQTYYWENDVEYEMMGDEALTYSRARHDSGKDYNRGIRQQQMVKALSDKILTDGFSLSVVDNLFSLVETDMPLKLVYSYYTFATASYTLQSSLENEKDLVKSDLPDEVWTELFATVGFNKEFTGNEKKDEEIMKDFNKFIKNELSKSSKESYFFVNYTLDKNEQYSAHYNANLEQLQEISDALRINLGLKSETISLPKFEYGDNYAMGLMPKETSNGSSQETYVDEATYVEEQTEYVEPVVEEPIVEEPVVEEPVVEEVVEPEVTEPVVPEVVEPVVPEVTEPVVPEVVDPVVPEVTEPVVPEVVDPVVPEVTDPVVVS